MKASKWLGMGLAVSMLSSVALVGCGTTNSTDGSNTASKKDSPQVLNLTLGDEVPTLDLSKAEDALSFDILGQVDEGLVGLDKDGKPIPAVAKSWDISPDGKTYTFHLRDDAKWADGTPVTAKDFVYSWLRTMAPETKADYAFMFDNWIKGANDYSTGKAKADSVGVKATDDHTLVVTLNSPVPFFLAQMNFPIFYPEQKAAVDKYGDKYGGDADKVMTNGPFKVESWTHDQSVTLVKSDTYFNKDAIKLTKVNFQVVKDPASKENLYQTGQIDRMSLIKDQVDRYKDSPEKVVTPILENTYFQFNTQKKPFNNANIRKALTYGVDADMYVDVIYHNGTVAATGVVPNGTSDGNGDFRKDNGDVMHRKENLAKAKDYLKQGLQELGLSTFPKVTLMVLDDAVSKKEGEFIQAQWKQNLGIDVDVSNVPFKLRLQKDTAKQFDVDVAAWGADYNDPMTFLDMYTSDNTSQNVVSYNSPKYDALIKDAKNQADASKRMQDMVDAEKVLINDMPIGPLAFVASTSLMKPYVKGWVSRLSGAEFDLRYTYIDGK